MSKQLILHTNYLETSVQVNNVGIIIGQLIVKHLNFLYHIKPNFNAFFTLPLDEQLSDLAQNLSIKANLSSFFDQIQDVINLISFGFRPIGFVFKDIPEYVNNVSILKKLANLFNVKVLFYGQLDYKKFTLFDIQTLKTENCQIISLNEKKLIKAKTYINLKVPLQKHYENQDDFLRKIETGVNNQLSIIDKYKISLNGELILNDKQQISDLIGDKEELTVNFFINQFQTQEEIENNELKFESLNGNCSVLVYVPADISILNLKLIMFEDLKDSINFRVHGFLQSETLVEKVSESFALRSLTDYNKLYFLKRIEVEIEQMQFSLQDYIENDQQLEEYKSTIDYEKKIQVKVKNIKVLEKQGQLIRNKEEKEINLPSPIKTQVEQTHQKLDPKIQSFYRDQYLFMGILVLIMSIYFGVKWN